MRLPWVKAKNADKEIPDPSDMSTENTTPSTSKVLEPTITPNEKSISEQNGTTPSNPESISQPQHESGNWKQ